MRGARIIISLCIASVAASTLAGEPEPVTPPTWEFALTAYPTVVQDRDNNYTSAIASADRGPLHLEARYNYEAVGARSAFTGWNFSGGDAVEWEITPLLGGVWGPLQAVVPGVELSLVYQRFDFYLEGEYVDDGDDPYTYAWIELGFAARDWAAHRGRGATHADLRRGTRCTARTVRPAKLEPLQRRRLLVQSRCA